MHSVLVVLIFTLNVLWQYDRTYEKNTFIAALIRAFGYTPPAGIVPTYPNRFDLVWVLTFPAPVPSMRVDPILQELLFDDPTTFP